MATTEADERLRWLEARISSSLRPRAEDLRNLFTDEENRAAFLAFCNHSESRRLFVHIPEEEGAGGGGGVEVTPYPPRSLSEKSIFFLKCSHASKLSRESIAEDVVYSECSRLPLQHLEMVAREVYLPLVSMMDPSGHGVSGDKLLDLLHRLVAALQVTSGLAKGEVVLPLPSIEVLAEAASFSDRRSAVIHVMESSVVAWMKQVKMALHFDPGSAIIKSDGKYAGPLAEVTFWFTRLSRLESVRDQLGSVVVLNILHNLEQAHSTYAQAFSHVHRDISKAILDTELCLMYVNALKPWLVRLTQAFSPDTLVKTFPPLMTSLLLVWQHSGFYSSASSLHRLLRLLSNEVMNKARDIIGEDILSCPEQSLVNLKLALRACAAFRGCYLDYKEKADAIGKTHKEPVQAKEDGSTHPHPPSHPLHPHTAPKPAGSLVWSGGVVSRDLAPWPPRNSPVFSPLNAIMERCNDLLELVQTMQAFRELEVAAYGVGGADPAEEGDGASTDPLLADIYSEYAACMKVFQEGTADLLSLEADCSFEENFFQFRSTVKSLEQRLTVALCMTFDLCPTLMTRLRVLEMYQGISRRDAIKASLVNRCDRIMNDVLSEIQAVSHHLTSHLSHPPSHPHTPPTASKLLWLQALRERASVGIETLRQISPHLLEGELGWKARRAYSDLITSIDSHVASTESSWVESVQGGLAKRLRHSILTRDSTGHLQVNLDPELHEIISEAHFLTRPPLTVKLPAVVKVLVRSVDVRELRDRQTSLASLAQAYNDLRERLSEVDTLLFQHKLQILENLLSAGLEQLDWTSSDFLDFLAKTKAMVCGELQPAVATVHRHTAAIKTLAESWPQVQGLDIFTQGEGTLEGLQTAYCKVLENLQQCLQSSVKKINTHIHKTLECVEASQESPAWSAYLTNVDKLVLQGLKSMVLTAIGTLVHRAQSYEQGGHIPALVTVNLELQGDTIQFSPPLTPHTSLSTVPEVVQQWMENYIGVTKSVPRPAMGQQGESCFSAISTDPDICSGVGKICAHLETNSRQCQSLCKRFTMYAFLWEQDVWNTFTDFLRGQAPPHPRRFSRPETVRSRASARAQRPVSAGQSQLTLVSSSAVAVPEAGNLTGVMGVSDWEFLCPLSWRSGSHDDGEGENAKRLSLDDFDGELAIFQGILERLSNTEDVANVGWLCVDQRPAKQALSSMAAKWKHVYANHLERQAAHVLESLERFFAEIEPLVEGISGEECDTQAFMRMMSIFNRVNSQQVEMDTKFGAVHRAVLMLDKFGHPLQPHTRDQFNNAPLRWSNLKKRVALSKQRIGPRIQANEAVISQDLSTFGSLFHTLHEQFYSSQCLRHDCPREEARGMIAGFREKAELLQSQARDLTELQELLETSVFNFSLLKEFDEELTTLQELWSITESILAEHSEWSRMSWMEVNSSDLIMATEREMGVASAIPPSAHQWDVYLHLVQTVRVVQTTIPLVEGLRSPVMRPRHWKQVLRYATGSHSFLLGRGSSFKPEALQELTFGQLLELGLHAHSSEVRDMVERANKEVSIESLLNTFEEVWLSRQLELHALRRPLSLFRQETLSELGLDADHSTATPRSTRAPSTRVTSARIASSMRKGGGGGGTLSGSSPLTSGGQQDIVMCITNTGPIFEILESHQISLQSLVGTVAATSFTDDLSKWHKQLQTIEAVLGAWLSVQRLWVQLEEVYASGEVQQHLPSHAFTFGSVDREWKELMVITAKNPSVMTACLKEGVLLSFEKMHSSLVQCQAALVQYVESQRTRCPWFYLLPLEEILQFVCYGSAPYQLSGQISKLLPHCGGLVFDHALPPPVDTPTQSSLLRGGRKITGVISKLGEKMELNQAVFCEGPVEGIITQLFSSLSGTLQQQLANAVLKYITCPPSGQCLYPSLTNLPTLWSSSLSTQVILLSTHIALEISLERAIQEGTKGSDPLKELSQELNNLVKMATQFLQGRALAGTGTEVPDSSATEQMSLVPQLDSQALLDSNVALHASASNVQAVGSSFSNIDSSQWKHPLEDRMRNLPTQEQIDRFQSVVLVLASFGGKLAGLSSQLKDASVNLSCTFQWKSLLHFKWLAPEKKCSLTSLHTSVPYGYTYLGNVSKIMLTPLLERKLVFLLKAVGEGINPLLVGKEGTCRSSVVYELAQTAGYPLTVLPCSPQLSHCTLTNFIRGMAATGSWLLLRGVDSLPSAVLHSTCSLLLKVARAKHNGSAGFQYGSETVKIISDIPYACFATISPPASEVELPHSLLEAFKTCSVPAPERRMILEALFLVHGFSNAARLAGLMAMFCDAVDELFNKHPLSFVWPPEDKKREESRSVVSSRGPSALPLGLQLLRAVVALSQRHMKEFELLGVLGESSEQQPLHMPSLISSEYSTSTRASLKFTSVVLRGQLSGSSSRQKVLQKQSLEEFSLVLAIKDCLLPALLPESSGHSILVKVISDVFPSCDIQGLLEHESEVREGLKTIAMENKEAAESVRESRAASAMQMVNDDRMPSEVGTTLEEHITQSCLLHSFTPTVPFQLAVSQLLTLVQSHCIVAVSGPSCSGKSACIKVAADMARELGTPLSLTVVACGAMTEEDLFGYRDKEKKLWQDGLVPQLLTRHAGGDATNSRPSSCWLVLDGPLSPTQLDTLASLHSSGACMTLSDGRAVPIERTQRFILELPDLCAMSPSSAVKIAKLTLSSSTVSWRDRVCEWISSQEKVHQKPLQDLFEKYVPDVLDLLAPVLASTGGSGEGEEEEEGGSQVSVAPPKFKFYSQKMKLNEIHLTNSCCTILESLLSSSAHAEELDASGLERSFIYSAVWAFGGFLSPQNKAVFNGWWRERFDSASSCGFPERHTVWDYFIDSTPSGFSSWRECVRPYVPPASPNVAPFVHTAQSVAINHLITLLMDAGQPVLIAGDTGSGKTAVLKQLFDGYCQRGVTETGLVHLYCNPASTARFVWGRLRECLQWQWGRNYAPEGCKRLVCFIDDLHNAQFSPTQSCSSVSEVVRHHLSSGGVYDPHTGKWHSVSDVTYVCTADAHQPHALDPRMMKHFTVLQWDGYDHSSTHSIFSSVLKSHFSSSPAKSPASHVITDDLIDSIVHAALQIHDKLRSLFLSTPERCHYVFTLRDIAAVFRQVCRCSEPGIKSCDLMLLWQRESWWAYGGVLSSEVDRERFWETVTHTLRKFFSGHEMLPSLLHDQSVRLSSAVLCSLRAQLEHLLEEYNLTHPALHINLYDSTVEEIWHLSHLVSSPHDLGNVILIGHAHPGPPVHLAALHAGFTVVQPSHYYSPALLSRTQTAGISERNYGMEEFQRDLQSVYSAAGVKDEKLLLLVNTTELLHSSFLTALYQFIKDCFISPLFSTEQRARIINAVRADMMQAGLSFTKEAAWDFFIGRVQKNLRVVLAVSRLAEAVHGQGSEGWKELVSATNIHYHLPWDRKQLVENAVWHLKRAPLLPDGMADHVAHLLASLHLSLREAPSLLSGNSSSLLSTSNSDYEYFVSWFVHELNQSYAVKNTRRSKLKTALQCINEASERAAQLEERLGRERIVLEEKTKACEKLLSQIGQDTAISREHSKLAAKQKSRIAHLKKVIPEYEHTYELAVEEQATMVQSSKQLVSSMSHDDLVELRGIQKPPLEIEELLAAVIMILKSPSADLSWTKGAKRLMANLDRFRDLLLECSESEENSEVILESLDPLLEKSSFSAKELYNLPGGVAASQLCSWVQGVVRLHTALQAKLRPLQSRVSTMKASLSEFTERLKLQESKVKILQDRLSGLNASLESASVDRSRQHETVNSMAKELRETLEFVKALEGFHGDWQQEVGSGHPGTADITDVGGLAITVTMATYLSSTDPHIQVDIIDNILKPVLDERGIALSWKIPDPLRCSTLDSTASQGQADDSTEMPVSPSTELPVSPSADAPTALDYSQTCTAMLQHLVSPPCLDRWQVGGLGPVQLLPIGIIASSWNKWPLVFDPDGHAEAWIEQYCREKLTVLDGNQRSGAFFLSLEQALVTGQSVLIKNIGRRLDPALQPLIELGHTWDSDTGAKVIRFCGRKLHVHPSFRLYLTTATPPHSLSTDLLTSTATINFITSLPLAQELLTEMILAETHDTQQHSQVSQRAAEVRARLTEVEEKLFEQLAKERGEGQYWWSAEKIAKLVAQKNELSSELQTSAETLQRVSKLKSHLLPLAHAGSLMYSILNQLSHSPDFPYYRANWNTFKLIFSHSLKQHIRKSSTDLSTCDGRATKDIVPVISRTILQHTVSCLAHSLWLRLASSLVLLSHCDLHLDPQFCVEQLLYLSGEEEHLSPSQIPPHPACVSESLWKSIHEAPLSRDYFRAVVVSVHSDPPFWEGLMEASEQTALEVASFPWKAGGGDGNPVTLDDLVILDCISPGALSDWLEEKLDNQLEGVSVPLLADVLASECDESDRAVRRPVLLLHDEGSSVSQTNSMLLEEELNNVLQGKSLEVGIVGAGTEDQVTSLLLRSPADVLLVCDLQHCSSSEWMEQLMAKAAQAMAKGCQVIFTSTVCHSLSSSILSGSRTVLLSRVAFQASSRVAKALWLNKVPSFHHLLQHSIASTPSLLVSQCTSLPDQLKVILFNLALLHTAVSSQSQPSPAPSAPHYSTLLALVSQLILTANKSSTSPQVENILSSLNFCAQEMYTLWTSTEELFVTCLAPSSVSPETCISFRDGSSVVTPSVNVSPQLYLEHATGLTPAEPRGQLSSPSQVTRCIKEILAPAISSLPGVEHYWPQESDPLSPDHILLPTQINTARLQELLETCSEQLPRPLSMKYLKSCEGFLSIELTACSDLSSLHEYQAFVLSKILSHYNTTLTTISSDISLLFQLASSGLDTGLSDLPSSVLQHLLRRRMPPQWSLGVGEGFQPLSTAFQELHDVLSLFLNRGGGGGSQEPGERAEVVTVTGAG